MASMPRFLGAGLAGFVRDTDPEVLGVCDRTKDSPLTEFAVRQALADLDQPAPANDIDELQDVQYGNVATYQPGEL